jgi:hypothetical protein
MLDNIIAWKNYLTNGERDIIKKNFDDGKWELIGWSQQTPETRLFWYKELINIPSIVTLFKNKTETFLNKQIEVNKLYANGQAHGQCGMFHTDVNCDNHKNEKFFSLVYYLHDDWQPEYGGHLMIKNDNNIESYWPESNSAILFKSDLWHCPLEPTIYCKKQRLSIAFKFKII